MPAFLDSSSSIGILPSNHSTSDPTKGPGPRSFAAPQRFSATGARGALTASFAHYPHLVPLRRPTASKPMTKHLSAMCASEESPFSTKIATAVVSHALCPTFAFETPLRTFYSTHSAHRTKTVDHCHNVIDSHQSAETLAHRCSAFGDSLTNNV